MPDKYLLNKAIVPGTIYRTEPDAFFVVRKVGTNSTTKATLKIEGAPVLEILNVLAQIETKDAIRFPPVDLQELYAVIPPDKVFDMTGEAAKYLRLVGELWMLRPGEGVPPIFSGRFTEQPKRYYTYQTGTGGIGASASWADKAEYSVIDYTVPAGERHKFKRHAYVARTGVLVARGPGIIALRVYVDDKPLDIHDPAKEPMGIDTCGMHYYDGAASFYLPWLLEDMPIELEPGHKLTIYARNISGAAIATGVGEEAKVQVTILDEKAYI